MALEVEDGTAKSNAESFISVADADTYFSNRGNAAWAALTTAQKEQSLRKATDYMEGVYSTRWNGYIKTATQALSWPRSFVYKAPFVQGAVGAYPYLVADDIVPVEVSRSCAELAVRASSETLAADLDVAVVSEKIDVIEVEYDTNAPAYKQYRAVDLALRPYLKSGGIELVAS